VKAMKSLILAAAVFSAAAFAHTDEYLDTQKSPNGGQLRMAGAYHFELVVAKDAKEAAESPVVIYVTDHAGAKVPTAGAVATATLLSGKTKASVVLAPDGDNRLKGSARYAANPDLKAVVSITLSGKAAEQARFTPLAAPKAAPAAAVATDGHKGHMH